MLFGNESISSYSRSNITVWMALAFQAGFINVGGFMACHRFVSHITGFATFFGIEANDPQSPNPVGMLIVPIFFLLGAMVSGQLVDLRLSLKKRPRYYLTFGIMFFLILSVLVGGVAGFFGGFGEPLAAFHDYLLLTILCLTCGIQNGTITTVSKSIVRTTHLTGITTDLGIGIVRVLNRQLPLEQLQRESSANMMRIGIIGFFLLGSVLGAWAFTHWQYMGFAIPTLTSGTLFAIMLYFQVWKQRNSSASRT